LKEVNRSNIYILGAQVAALEERVAAFTHSKFAVSVNSCTDALFLSLKAFGIGQGDEVITVSNSFIATAGAIVATGATPIFVDVDADLNIDTKKIAEKITAKTKAIIPVHLTGKPAKMLEVCRIAHAHKLVVIEDAAQAFGATLNGKNVGSFGDVGCFSFHPFKVLGGLGDGGMMVTDDESLYKKLIKLRNHGIDKGVIDSWGYNSRLDAIQAAWILKKLENFDAEIMRRNALAALYGKTLQGVVECPLIQGERQDNEFCAYQTYIIKADQRSELISFLLKAEIETAIHYPTPIPLQPVGKQLGYKEGDLPVTETLSRRILSLPMYTQLKDRDINFIAEKIVEFHEMANHRQ
jgi:dTDP-4-amino-4,6-dideoxygalactose transaminase